MTALEVDPGGFPGEKQEGLNFLWIIPFLPITQACYIPLVTLGPLFPGLESTRSHLPFYSPPL